MSGDPHDLTAIVVDTDVTSRMWRAGLPAEIERIPDKYAALRAAAAAKGQNVAHNDCWIAACCLSHGLPLMTWNRRHFEPLEPFGLTLP